jgi:hypothetical protein
MQLQSLQQFTVGRHALARLLEKNSNDSLDSFQTDRQQTASHAAKRATPHIIIIIIIMTEKRKKAQHEKHTTP